MNLYCSSPACNLQFQWQQHNPVSTQFHASRLYGRINCYPIHITDTHKGKIWGVYYQFKIWCVYLCNCHCIIIPLLGHFESYLRRKHWYQQSQMASFDRYWEGNMSISIFSNYTCWWPYIVRCWTIHKHDRVHVSYMYWTGTQRVMESHRKPLNI